jgi:hypothetical protein
MRGETENLFILWYRYRERILSEGTGSLEALSTADGQRERERRARPFLRGPQPPAVRVDGCASAPYREKMPNLSAIRTNSAREGARIFCMT